MTLNCKKCNLHLGELDKGKIRNGTAMLCPRCWSKAEIAMQIAELASQGTPPAGSDEKVVNDLMGMFGMKGGRDG